MRVEEAKLYVVDSRMEMGNIDGQWAVYDLQPGWCHIQSQSYSLGLQVSSYAQTVVQKWTATGRDCDNGRWGR